MSQENAQTITADKEGVIRQWGRDAERIFGYTSEEALGRRVDLIVPPVLQGLHWRGFNKAMRRERLRRPDPILKVPALHKSGEMMALRATLALHRGEDGSVDGAVATIFGTGSAWRGTAWRAALAPLKLGQWVKGRIRRPTHTALEAARLRE
jgi:PAS domain S-box-containing protein